MRPSVHLAIAFTLTSFTLVAQQSHNHAVPTAGTQPSPPMMMAMPMVAPIFVEDDKTSSTLVVVNNSSIRAGAMISVHSVSGQELVNIHRILMPHEQQELSLQGLLSRTPSPVHTGSIMVMQDSNLKGMTVVSQLLMTNRRGSLPSYVDEELAMPSSSGSTILRGVADEAVGDALVAITNITGSTQHVTLHCLGETAELRPAHITVLAMATSLVNDCSGNTVRDMDSYLDKVGQKKSQRVRGYELIASGGAGTIAAFGLAPHYRNHDVVLSSVPFADPAELNSPNTVFVGVPFGPQSALPDGIYSPQISISNFAASPANVSISIATTPQDQPSSVSNAGTSPEKRLVRQLTIAPRRTVELKLNDSSSEKALLQSLMIDTDKQPGEVQSKVVSRSDGNLYEVELLGKDQKDMNDGGSHPWSTEDDLESHLLLFNHSDKPLVFGVGISNGSILWDKKYTIAPYETRDINFNELIRDRVKDNKGRTLSPRLSRGVVNWMVPDSRTASGRLMVASRSQNMARSFSCGQFIVVCGLTILTSNSGMLPINDFMALYTADPSFCDEFGPGQCGGGSQTGSGSASYNWTAGTATVVKLNTASDQFSQGPNLYGVGAGTGFADVIAQAGQCQSSGGGSPTVQVPTYFFTTGAFNVSASACALNQVGSLQNIQYYVAAQNSARISLSGMTPLEQVTLSGKIEVTWASFSTPVNTLADGSFNDDPVGTCFGPPVPTGNACVFPSQDFEATEKGMTYSIKTNTSRKDCSQGQQTVIQGNPTNFNHTYIQGTVP